MDKIAKIIMGLGVIVLASQVQTEVKAVETEKTAELIIKYKEKDQLSLKEQKQLNIESKEVEGEAELVEVTDDNKEATIKKLEAEDNIDYVVENTRYQIAADSVGELADTYASKQWNIAAINASTAWVELKNKTNKVKVAVVDTGVYSTHEDLKGRIIKGETFLNEGNNGVSGVAEDDQGHGTSISGIIAAKTNNGLGISGVTGNTNIEILPVKVMDSSGNGDSFYIAKGIKYAVNQGANVINLSISGDYNEYLENAINYAYENDVLVVAAAGNGGGDADTKFPGALKHVISVGSITTENKVFSRSNIGSTVDLVAPGVGILSTSIKQSSVYEVEGLYNEGTGTSYATPHISAVAALYKLKYPKASVDDIEFALQSTATDIEEVGRDDKSGDGLINAQAALAVVPLPIKKTIPTVTSVSINNNTATATVKTEKLATVELKVNNIIYNAIANNNGVATFKIAKPKAGIKWTVTATNKFEKVYEISGKVADKIAPKINSVVAANNTNKVTVKTEGNAKVTLIIANKTYTKTANAKGQAIITITKPKAGIKWTVTAADAAKNKTTLKGKVIDKVAPKIVKLTKTVKTSSTSIVGTAEKNSVITVYRNAQKYKTVAASAQGTFKVAIAKQKKNTKISIYSKDKAGNQSKALKLVVK